MAKEKRNSEMKGGGLYRGVKIPIWVLDLFILLAGGALAVLFIFLVIFR